MKSDSPMRTAKYIKHLTAQLCLAWQLNPDLRLTQLICNCFSRAGDLYFMEDDELEACLEQLIADAC